MVVYFHSHHHSFIYQHRTRKKEKYALHRCTYCAHLFSLCNFFTLFSQLLFTPHAFVHTTEGKMLDVHVQKCEMMTMSCKKREWSKRNNATRLHTQQQKQGASEKEKKILALQFQLIKSQCRNHKIKLIKKPLR